jgi:hypothetical protein
VGSIEPKGHEIIFQGHFQGPNVDQYRGTNLPRQGNLGYYQYLSGPVYLLSKDQQQFTLLQWYIEFLSS